MSVNEKRAQLFKKTPFTVIGVVLLAVLAAFLLYFNNANSQQAIGATAAQIKFEGDYRIADSEWQSIVVGEHIPSTKGDVTLRGNFHLYSPGGEYIGILKSNSLIAFYTDHISVTIFKGDGSSHTLDHENPLFGASACGIDWTACSVSSDGINPIEMVIHNPHSFGNETAVDELISSFAIWGNLDFERDVLESGKTQRNIGLTFIIVGFVLLGSALFSALLHVKNSGMIWLSGLSILAAGGYFAYGAPGVSFWSESIATNTTMLCFTMMFYMLFICMIITYFMHDTKKIAIAATAALGVFNGVGFILPVFTKMHLFDILPFWVICQSIVNLVLLFCLLKEYLSVKKHLWGYVGLSLALLAFEIDAVATALALYKGGIVSGYVFIILFALSLFAVLRVIPNSINASAKAKELELQRSQLEAELKDSRVSIMLSQIRPHFIYNTLGTIERMCLKDSQKAFDLVRNFSLYLRGNFSELDSVTPIRFEQELKHVEYYVNIEKVRFPDMNIEYDVKATDFVLPALSVQPLVENAIKHGLMPLETGGTIVIRSYETPCHFCVEVSDDGAGFDTSLPTDEKKHVGVRNIKGRLKAMVNGELIIESELKKGTKAIIMIPKECAQ